PGSGSCARAVSRRAAGRAAAPRRPTGGLARHRRNRRRRLTIGRTSFAPCPRGPSSPPPSTSFRLIIENMPHTSTEHEVLAVVFQVRHLGTPKPQLSVLLWERAMNPQRGAWSLPGGRLRNDEDMTSSIRRQLAEKVDLREIAHLEQLAVF